MLTSRHNVGIVKCSHCKKILASEEFDAHECCLELHGQMTIEVINFLDVSFKNKKLMQGHGVDGVLYTFEVVPRKPIPYVMPLSDEFLHEHESDKDFTEPVEPIYEGGLSLQRDISPQKKHPLCTT
jgi:hypothetical protein